MINASFVTCLCEELNRELSGGRIDKIQQPARDVVLLTVRTSGENRRLLLSASPGKARIHLTALTYENPSEPPLFCVLLRKHLTGALINSFEQPGLDRLIVIRLTCFDDLGRETQEQLVVEMIPGKTNIVLVGLDGLIVDCAYRRDYDADLYRRLAPGMIYRLPPQPENFTPPSGSEGFSSPDFATLSAFLDSYYSAREKEEVYRRRSKELRTSLSSAEKRIRKKLGAQRIELQNTAGREEFRRRADLITANIWRLKRGEDSLICEDFFDPSAPTVTVPLDPLLTPQANAAKLYKQYNKLKTAEAYLKDLIAKAEAQLDYIASVQEELSRASSDRDIADIRSELIAAGILKNRNRKTAKKEKPQAPLSMRTDEGFDVLAGRSNLQNDELTFRTAYKNDLWFHVKTVHGSHVILRCGNTEPSARSVEQAAAFAVKNSQGREGENIPVDYTRIRFVKKSPSALPGKVLYTDYKTIYIRSWKEILSEN